MYSLIEDKRAVLSRISVLVIICMFLWVTKHSESGTKKALLNVAQRGLSLDSLIFVSWLGLYLCKPCNIHDRQRQVCVCLPKAPQA